MNTEELRKVAEAATPGPWFVCRNVNDDGTVDIETGRQADWPPAQNCEFPTCHHIAAFNPKTAIALLDRIAALEAENAELRKIVSDSLAALGTTAGCSPECSMEFMKGVPEEIAGTITALREALAKPAVPEGWREFLKEIEWANYAYNRAGDAEPYCVCCDNWQSEGHKADCKFAAMLAAAPQPKDKP